MEILEALCYKLCMFGVPIDGSMNIFCDIGAVCVNMTWTESTISKKHHSIAHHSVQEPVVTGTVRVSRENTPTNLADLFNKTTAAPKIEGLLDTFRYSEAN